jgi:hypothetical protein
MESAPQVKIGENELMRIKDDANRIWQTRKIEGAAAVLVALEDLLIRKGLSPQFKVTI